MSFRAAPFAAALLAAAILLPARAVADLLPDQQQLAIDLSQASPSVDNLPDSQQKLAQTVTAGLAGNLVEVRLPVACASGTLIVEIVSLDGDRPGTTVLSRTEVPAADLPPGDRSAFRSIVLDTAIPSAPGDRFAIVLRNETGTCGLTAAAGRNPYRRGDGFYDARPNPPGWVPWRSPGHSADLAFVTVVDTPPDDRCRVTGFGPLPIPDFVPLCRCVQDPGLREMRCGLFHPDFFLFRTIPFPLPPGEPIPVRWTMLPLVELKGTLEVTDRLPPGFKTDLKGPLVFDVGQVPRGEAVTLEYKVVAGANGGRFKVTTEIGLSSTGEAIDGTMRTFIDVGKADPKKP